MPTVLLLSASAVGAGQSLGLLLGRRLGRVDAVLPAEGEDGTDVIRALRVHQEHTLHVEEASGDGHAQRVQIAVCWAVDAALQRAHELAAWHEKLLHKG